MAIGKRIVFLDVTTPGLRAAFSAHLPSGFELTFAEADTEERMAAAVADADYVLVWAAKMPAKVMEAAGRVRLIQKIGEGTDRLDVPTAARMGIPVAKTTGASSTAVAEAATMLILSTLRWLPNLHNAVVAGRFPKFEYRDTSYELRGKQVGLIGTGKIGRIVAEHMKGFGASLVYCDVVRMSSEDEARLRARLVPLQELLRTSDVISIHVPLTSSTRGMIGSRALSLMKPTAILVNTCRGPVVDEQALCEALKEKRIRGAGIDALWQEPPEPNSPLLRLDNVVLMPHCAAGTVDAQMESIRHGYANIVKCDRGELLSPEDLVQVVQSAAPALV
ncbi:MAG: 2-hydroxyacid dehydrogenase [Terriglobales bacterium]